MQCDGNHTGIMDSIGLLRERVARMEATLTILTLAIPALTSMLTGIIVWRVTKG